MLVLRGFCRGERWLRRAGAAIRAGDPGQRRAHPARGRSAAVVLASAACLVVSQFVNYRSVEIGQPGYAGLTAAAPPTVAAKTAGEAHAYVLVPLALLAASPRR